MSETTKIKVYKYKNIAGALAVVLLVLVAVSTSCSPDASKRKAAKQADTEVSSAEEIEPENEKIGKRLTKNYIYKEMQNGTALYNGLLLQVDGQHPFKGQTNNTESLYSFLFDSNGEQVMAASYPSDEALPEMLRSLSAMAVDFEGQSGGNGMIMVTSLIPADDGAQKTDEAYIGSSADLMVFDGGSYLEFTGTEDFAWILHNCYKYGFIMRGSDRLRYIGKETAAVIRYMSQTDGSADLEKFQADVKGYSFEEPMFLTTDDSIEYAAYFVPTEEGTITTSVPIPVREDDSEYTHIISGNNDDGYIVIVNMSDNTDSNIINVDSGAESLPEADQ